MIKKTVFLLLIFLGTLPFVGYSDYQSSFLQESHIRHLHMKLPPRYQESMIRSGEVDDENLSRSLKPSFRLEPFQKTLSGGNGLRAVGKPGLAVRINFDF